MITTFSAVKAICLYNDWTVSNLSIQKLLYISQLIHLGENSKDESSLTPLIKSGFYAWMYGPVVPRVYRELKMFGAENVVNFSILAQEPGPDETMKEYQTIKYVCDTLKGVKSSQLVAYTHSPKSAWSHFYNPDRPETVIPNAAIYAEYRRREYA